MESEDVDNVLVFPTFTILLIIAMRYNKNANVRLYDLNNYYDAYI